MLLAHERSREATAFKFLKIVNSQQKGTTVMDKTRFDKIEIKELEIFANHGVYPEENVLGQKFVFLRKMLLQMTKHIPAYNK